MSEIKPIVPLVCCDIPTVYSNKQSYYECLCYIGSKINECIEMINSFTDDYKNYTDEQIAKLKATLEEELQNAVDTLNKKIDFEVKELDEKIVALSTSITEQLKKLKDLIYTVNENTKAWAEYEIEKLYEYIDNVFCDNVKCYNPTNGMYEPICKVLNDIYGKLRYFGITAEQYDSLQLTADDYDALMISASDYDLYAKMILYKSKWFYMYSPFSGKYEFYQDVIYQMADLLKPNPITAAEYDALNITATNYDDKQITASQYDDNAKTILNT